MTRTEGVCRAFGGIDLYCQTWRPDKPAIATAVFVHGIGDHGGRHMNLVNALVAAGLAVVAPDLRGHGRSPGLRGHVDGWQDYREDVHAVVQSARAASPGLPLFVIGHSLGGLIVLEYALRYPEGLKGVVAMSPALALDGVPRWKIVASRVLDRFAPRLSLRVGLDSGGMSRDPAVKAADDEDPLLHKLGTVRLGVSVQGALRWTFAHAAELRVPLLVAHGMADTVVPAAASEAFFGRLTRGDRTRLTYDGGYHELDNDTPHDRALRDITAWITARLA
jgi:alpha-beta hydrolase superfamily lysophospholipase